MTVVGMPATLKATHTTSTKVAKNTRERVWAAINTTPCNTANAQPNVSLRKVRAIQQSLLWKNFTQA